MKENYLDLSKEQFAEFAHKAHEGKIQMLNLIKFKDRVEENGRTGEEQYDYYLKQAMPYFIESKATVLFYGAPSVTLIGPPGELEWDKVLIVEYENKSAFINMITKPGYPANLRALALEDSRLISCNALDMTSK